MTTVVFRRLTFAPRILGESPPPPPRACFGRDQFIEKIVGLAETLTPIALIGAGGIGKTSITLTVLHDDRIKQQFGDDRRFIRCDQFPPSLPHLLSRLSAAIGAGIENPKGLTPLRPSLSSREMLVVLDNAESILDPLGPSAQEIYAAVEELSHFSNICLCITSRISTVPPDCEILDIPTLPMESARDVFYRIYKNGERRDRIDNILEQLGFHPLSITLLATVAHHNRWNTGQLVREWDKQRTGLLHTQHNQSLAVTIELSLTSLMFQELGPDAQALLGVIAFSPQGVNNNNLGWLFPTIPNRTSIIDKFCIPPLTYQSNGFITMLAPLQDHLCPKDPKSSPLLCKTKQCYFSRLSAQVDPGKPGFEEAQWITSEDVNVEHLLDVFTSLDANPGNGWGTYPRFMKHLLGAFAPVDTNLDNVWDACAGFMRHIYRHKPHLIMLGPKIEGLPDNHHSKPECLFWLSQLFHSVGNGIECRRLLTNTLRLCREQGDDFQVAQILVSLSNVSSLLDHLEEGIQQVEEALGIYKQLKDISGQGLSLWQLAVLLSTNNQHDAAEEAASQALDLLSSKGNQFEVCQCYCVLGSTVLYMSFFILKRITCIYSPTTPPG